ncbi:MAG: flagellar basal body L-ring protein FlgH [Syntrophaceae bacterium]|nr:flagellar basal body L-ring protein FlgH [Syntrophaceae bacterium]
MIKIFSIPTALVLTLIWGTGCLTPQSSSKSTYSMPPASAQQYSTTPPSPSEGSLWVSSRGANLCADVKARNVGDIVTINVVESATASNNASTKTARSSGLEASWSGVLQKLSGDWVGGEVKAGFENNFDGKGDTTRSSQLSAYITAQVIQVLPNGYLAIHGNRQVRVNHENQIINVQGVIRTEDINANNIILSTYISDAKIELIGQGAVSDKQRPGWLARILDWVWPF